MPNQYDFDQLSELYKNNPEEFQIATRQMIDDYIASIPNEVSRRKCAGLQFRLDHELKRYHDPIARMNKMVEIFWEGVSLFNSALNGGHEITYKNAPDNVIQLKELSSTSRDSKKA
jgi:Protein of unknown function (DUF3135)